MIAWVTGHTMAFREGMAIIRAGDVGYAVFVTHPTAAKLNRNAHASLWTHQHVREDAISLYGFETLVELEGFERLLAVKGMGPKNAMRILGSTDIGTLTKHATAQDIAALMEIPGIGARSAEAICEELGE